MKDVDSLGKADVAKGRRVEKRTQKREIMERCLAESDLTKINVIQEDGRWGGKMGCHRESVSADLKTRISYLLAFECRQESPQNLRQQSNALAFSSR